MKDKITQTQGIDTFTQQTTERISVKLLLTQTKELIVKHGVEIIRFDGDGFIGFSLCRHGVERIRDNNKIEGQQSFKRRHHLKQEY